MKKHWYKLYAGECPVCGRDQSCRERVYGDKPKDRSATVVELSPAETYDRCMEGQ